MEKETTFRRWVYDHSDALYRYTLQHLREEEPSKDLVQDTFLAAWRNIEGYKGEASVRNWLFVILKNKITDHYRKSRNQIVVEANLQESRSQTFFDNDDHWIEGAYPKSWSVDFTNQVEAKEFQQVFRS
jgi:RNA polymerase sigma factor (sigma-70 family)